ncbi:MAG: hypothetical protein LKJ88_00610 [Bacilli bacterium]|jgi:hypothetical protein|nr:hypothetical protein [Bacilli bacterium]
MATKMVFHPSLINTYSEEIVQFQYVQGLAFSQKQKNVDSLHRAVLYLHPGSKVLEVSTKSREKNGVDCSAFNLLLDGYYLESVFQAGKVFEGVGSFIEASKMLPKEARDYVKERSQNHSLIGFTYAENDFSLKPKTFFYDWLYLNALKQSNIDLNPLLSYYTFTDIEFNEKTQVNCQARSLAIAISLKKKGLLEQALKNPQSFLSLVYKNNL